MSLRKFVLFCSVLVTTALAINVTYAKEANMGPYYYRGQLLREERVVKVKSPIRATISFISTPEEIQKKRHIVLHIVYTNPAGSKEVGYLKKRLSDWDVSISSEGRQITPDRNELHTEIKPPPPTDNDYRPVKPGETIVDTWIVEFEQGNRTNGTRREMLEGTHQYEIFVAGNHALASIIDKTFAETGFKKFAITVDTNSNTLIFTYTKPAKAGQAPEQVETPPSPDKLNDADDTQQLTPQRLALGTQVSSLRSCPETGLYECAADTPGITEQRVLVKQGRPMPSGFIAQTKPGIAGILGAKEPEAVETLWTLVAYE